MTNRGRQSVAACLLSLAAGIAQATDDPREMLERLDQAIERLNYEGTFVHIVDGRADTMYVVHRVEDGVAMERLVSLDGPRREIIRDEGEVTCIFADEKSVMVERRKQDSPLQAAIPRDTERLDEHYAFRLLKPVNKLGRDASVLAIVPEDDLRYGYKLWIDDETGMLLKSQVLDRFGKVLEQLLFVSLELPESIPSERLKPSIATDDFTWYVQQDTTGGSDVGTAWQAEKLPSGFELKVSNTGVIAGDSAPVEHLVYSDGMASVSVFIDRADSESTAPEGPSRMGAANAYTTRVGDHIVTAMGEVPLTTVRMIAESVRSKRLPPTAAR
jgi:sigma-E factor negative regulatory protein RseB